LFAAEEHDGVFFKVVLLEKGEGSGDLGVEVLDFGVVLGEGLAGGGGVDEVGRQFQRVGVEVGWVAFVPGGVGFLGGKVEEEGLFGLPGDKGFHLLKVVLVADFFEGKGFFGAVVGLAHHADTVAEIAQVVGDALGSGFDVAVVGVGAAADGEQAGKELLAGGSAHGGGGEAMRKAEALRGEAVDGGGANVLVAVATDVVPGEVIGEDDEEVGRLRLCISGLGDGGKQAGNSDEADLAQHGVGPRRWIG